RMEQLAPPGTTRLTADTLWLADGFVQVKALGPIPVKGIAEPVDVFEFLHSHHRQGSLVLEASSVSYGKATAFMPLADLLRTYFPIEDGDDIRGVRAKITGTVLTLDRALEDALPAISCVLELTGAAAIRTRLQGARARGLSRFVGRDAEMAQIRQATE